jgi:hypothetical protein
VKLLLSGLDTVDCAYYLRGSNDCRLDFAALSLLREEQQASKRPEQATISLGGTDFLLSPRGTASGYPYLMENAEMRIQFGEFNNPGFFVNFRSYALWHKGAQVLHREFSQWAETMGLAPGRSEGLSRVDFAFDFHLPSIDFDENSFVTQASKDAQHRKDRRVQTFRFGEGDIVLRIYDKSAEIREANAKTWFHALWGGVVDNVWRVEFQVRKDVLKRFGLRTFQDLFDGSGDVLRFLVHEHTTLRVHQNDSNRSRWPIHPLWAMLQEHVLTLQAQGVVRELKPDERLTEQLWRLAIAVEGYIKRSAAIECVRRGGEVLSHEQAIEAFDGYLRQVHDPLTWRTEVMKRADQVRLGQW